MPWNRLREAGFQSGTLKVSASYEQAGAIVTGQASLQVDPLDDAAPWGWRFAYLGLALVYYVMVFGVALTNLFQPAIYRLEGTISMLKERHAILQKLKPAPANTIYEASLESANKLITVLDTHVKDIWTVRKKRYGVGVWSSVDLIVDWQIIHEVERLLVPCLAKGAVEREIVALKDSTGRDVLFNELGLTISAGTATPPVAGVNDQTSLQNIEYADAAQVAELQQLMKAAHERLEVRLGDLLLSQGKALWAVGVLLVAVCAAAWWKNPELLLLGAFGGILGRSLRNTEAVQVRASLSVDWSAFFISPLIGALTGWAGVLLVGGLQDLEILGKTYPVNWDAPGIIAQALAVVFGASERWFSGLLGKVNGEPST